MNLMSFSTKADCSSQNNQAKIAWSEIDLVFLDMDGTLLDKYFDDYFWEHHVPKTFATKNSLSFEKARKVLLETYRSVESTLAWTDLDYWSERLDLDIPTLKRDINHLINILPGVEQFLRYLNRIEKKVYLITNAHPKALAIKLEKVRIKHHFEKIVCSQDVGTAKEQPSFWERLQHFVAFDIQRTLFVDDTEKVLCSAKEYGFQNLVHIAKPSSMTPPSFSTQFPSIVHLGELMTPGHG